jgi:hypothetical protein
MTYRKWLNKSIGLAAFTFAVFIGTSALAYTQQPSMPMIPCFDKEQTEKFLSSEKAIRIGMGIDADGGLVHLYLTPDKEFHLLITPPNHKDRMCPITWGTDWMNALDMSL